jgi:hypothetical protein
MSISQFVLNVMALLPMALVVVCVPIGVYWMLEPPPLRVVYSSPQLISEPVDNPEDAAAHAVYETVGGRDLYRLVIYCVDRAYSGTIKRAWVNDAVIWHAPDRSTVLSNQLGCETVSSRIPVPSSSPTRSFELLQSVDVYVNPIRTDHVQFPPVTLTILDGGRK